MKLIALTAAPSRVFDIEFAKPELVMLSQSLSYVNGDVPNDQAFITILGASRAHCKSLVAYLDELDRRITGQQGIQGLYRLESAESPGEHGNTSEKLEVPMLCVQICRESAIVRLCKAEAAVLVKALSQWANGIKIYECEFSTRFGVSRSDVRILLEQLHLVLVMHVAGLKAERI